MPRLKRRRPRAHSCTPGMRVLLESGHWYGFLGGECDAVEPNEEAARETWEAEGDDLLAVFINAHPGRRPWAWWKWNATEPRREGETEAAYLQRLGLLTPEEKTVARRLTSLFATGRDEGSIARELDVLEAIVLEWRQALGSRCD